MARVKMTTDRLKELGVTMEDVNKYRKHISSVRRGGRAGGSKYKTVQVYDEYEGAAKWKHDNEAKEARKRKRAEKGKDAATVYKKRKFQMEVDSEGSSESSGKGKRKKAEAKQKGKAKAVVSDSSGGDDKGWKPTESEDGSSEGNHEEEDNVGQETKRANLYKKLKRVHRRPNMVPEVKSDFNQSKLEDYDVRLVGRSLCKMSTINMATFEEDYPFGVSEILRPFRGLLELSLPYCESVVKVFYSNLKMSRAGVVFSCVRGQRVEVNEKKLLQWLSVKCPQSKDTKFSGDETDKILLDGGTTDDGSGVCRPKQLPYKYRVLHYLYNRNFVNKGKHYSSLSIEDKQILSCLIQRKPFNMGKRIVDTMLRAAAMGKKNTDLPYPSLVSLILDKHKIWYLQDGEPPLWSSEFDDEALHRMRIPLASIGCQGKHESEGERVIEAKGQRSRRSSAAGGPSNAGVDAAAELGALFGQVLDDKLAVMKDELQALIEDNVGRLDSRMAQMALEFKGLQEFIHLYGSEFSTFASFKRTEPDHAGPSTKPPHTSVRGSAESSHHSPMTLSGQHQHVTGSSSHEEKQRQSGGSGNGGEGDKEREEEDEEEGSDGNSESEGNREGEEEDDDEDEGSDSGSRSESSRQGGEEYEDEGSDGGSKSEDHKEGEEEDEEEGSDGGSESEEVKEGKKQDVEEEGSDEGSGSEGNIEGEEDEEEEGSGGGHGSEGNSHGKEGDEKVSGGGTPSEGTTGGQEEEADGTGGGTGTEGHPHEVESDSHTSGGDKGTEGETHEEGMQEQADVGNKGTKSPTTDDKTSEQDNGGGDNVHEGPTAEKEIEQDHVDGDNANEGPTDEELDPVTPLSLVPLPEPVNPPPDPDSNIIDAVPLRFIPAGPFSSNLAAQNLPHIFSAESPIRPPPPRPPTPMYIPVNLPGSRTSSPRQGTRKSPAKSKKNN